MIVRMNYRHDDWRLRESTGDGAEVSLHDLSACPAMTSVALLWGKEKTCLGD